MAILRPARISTRQFTYDAQARKFIGEISSTHGFGRVYDDAADEGLTLVSCRTGAEVVFAVWEERRDDAENEITSWVLRPVGRPDLDGATLVLFND